MEIHPVNTGKIGKKEVLLLILCLLVGFALRFYTFDQKSLWMDEIHTFNDSRDGFKDQLKFYKEKPTYLHPPLFFILTHFFYPFTKPERDLRIFPLIFGTLSLPVFYFLSRLFSSKIALPCTVSLAFMTYHISLSQDGRSYSLLMFFGMAAIYFFMRHLQTLKRRFLFPAAFFFAILFYTSYSSVPFIIFSQMLWFYRSEKSGKPPPLLSFLLLNGLVLLLCFPWIVFVSLNYVGQPIMSPFQAKAVVSFWDIIYGIIFDWAPHAPLMIASGILLILFPYFSKSKGNALVLIGVFILPMGGVYLFCKLLNISHFTTSKYFINFLPIFFISIYLSLNSIETRLKSLKRFIHLRLLFILLFVISNLLILPLYYQSEKQNFRGLVTFLKQHLQDGDKIIDLETMGTLGILHYFGVHPEGRHFTLDYLKITGGESEYRKSFIYQNRKFNIFHSNICCAQYLEDRRRLWIIASKQGMKQIMTDTPCTLMGYFDGSFSSLRRFPTDASIYLLLWDPGSLNPKGMDIPMK
jgi:hypothetical protein